MNYANNSKFHLGQIVVRTLDPAHPKDRAQIVSVEFIMGGSIKYNLCWSNGEGGDAFEGELMAEEGVAQ